MLALSIEGLMDVAERVAVTSAFPPALTSALLEKLQRGDDRGLLDEQHYLDWVSANVWCHLVIRRNCRNIHSYVSRENIPLTLHLIVVSCKLLWHPGSMLWHLGQSV